MWVTKSTNRSSSPWAANWRDVAAAETCEASMPAPGRTTFMTTRPIASANVVTTSK